MICAFGDCELDEERYELRRVGAPIRLEPKAFRILAYLIQHRDRVVTRDELLEQFWPGEFVTASAPAHCIVKARQAVGDGSGAQRVIKTVHGHGYRFIAAVVTRQPETATPAVPPVSRPPIAEEWLPPPDTPVPLDHQLQTSQRIPVGERKQATVLASHPGLRVVKTPPRVPQANSSPVAHVAASPSTPHSSGPACRDPSDSWRLVS